MNANPYVGHESQLYGIEEHRLVGGKGDGMRLLEVNNGKGLEMTVSADRAADISRLRFKGVNLGYFSPCGYVAPPYYESTGTGFLKSFTAGFLTTCGLQSVGTPCVDNGEEFPLHGSISNTPAERLYWTADGKGLAIFSEMNDEGIFARKLRLKRKLHVSLETNEFAIHDEIVNTGEKDEPVEILYHMNMGYPLLDEDSEVFVSSDKVLPRNQYAAEDIGNWMIMEKPQPGYKERCYYHECKNEGIAWIYQPKQDMRLTIRFDPKQLDCFTEWKMMGVRDYVLGLECGNCYPDGRDAMRKQGRLKLVKPGESLTYRVKVELA